MSRKQRWQRRVWLQRHWGGGGAADRLTELM